MRDRTDGDAVEHFLEDGVAPAVIGGGPPESPFDPPSGEPEPEPEGRYTPRGREQDQRLEPPTSPIPVIRQPPPGQEPGRRRSWVARVLRLPDR